MKLIDPIALKLIFISDYSPLHIAASNENLQVVLTLLKNSPNIQLNIPENGNTPLHCAMRNIDVKVAECLISYDNDLAIQKNHNEELPLDLADHFHNDKMAAFLRAFFKFEYSVPGFEVLYYKYFKAKDEKEIHANIIGMLCDRIQNINEDEEDEEEPDQAL